MEYREFEQRLEWRVDRRHRRLIRRQRRLHRLGVATLGFGIVLTMVVIFTFLLFLR